MAAAISIRKDKIGNKSLSTRPSTDIEDSSLSIMEIPTIEQLMALSPAFLAENTSRVLFNVTTAFAVLTTDVCVLFLISRIFCAERNNLEIWVLPAFSYIFRVGLWTLDFFLFAEGGAGRHVAYWFLVDPTVITTYLKIQTAAEFVYVAAYLLPKLSILAFYLRIFTERITRISTWIIIGVCLLHAVLNTILSFTMCLPFGFKWNKTINGHCANVMASYRYVSVPHILTDIAIFVIPLSSLYHLVVSKKRKVGIFLPFIMGSLGIITSIIRFVSFYKIDLESDPTWHAPPLFSYAVIEPSAYFMCSCFPSLRPLMRVVYRWMRNDSGTARSRRYEISLSTFKGSHKTSVSATKSLSRRLDGEDKTNFIRLQESVDVDVSPNHVERRV